MRWVPAKRGLPATVIHGMVEHVNTFERGSTMGTENTGPRSGTIAETRERFLKLAEEARQGRAPARMGSPALTGLVAVGRVAAKPRV